MEVFQMFIILTLLLDNCRLCISIMSISVIVIMRSNVLVSF